MNTTRYRTPRSCLLTLCALTLLLISSDALAEKVYKWVDDSGTIHYSDIKPNHQESTSIKVSGGKGSGPAASPLDSAKALSEKEAAAQQKLEQLEKDKAQQEKTQAQCQNVRENLKTLQEKSRVKISENGELRYLTPEEIEKKKADYQRTIDEQC